MTGTTSTSQKKKVGFATRDFIGKHEIHWLLLFSFFFKEGYFGGMGSMLNPKLVYTTSYFPIRSVLGVRVRNCFLSSQLSVSYSHENIPFFCKIKEKRKSQWISCFPIKSHVSSQKFYFWEVLVVPVILNRGYHYDEMLTHIGTTLRHLP